MLTIASIALQCFESWQTNGLPSKHLCTISFVRKIWFTLHHFRSYRFDCTDGFFQKKLFRLPVIGLSMVLCRSTVLQRRVPVRERLVLGSTMNRWSHTGNRHMCIRCWRTGDEPYSGLHEISSVCVHYSKPALILPVSLRVYSFRFVSHEVTVECVCVPGGLCYGPHRILSSVDEQS